MNHSIVLQKLQTLDEVLTELRSLGQIGLVQLEDWRTRRAVERDILILSKTISEISHQIASVVETTTHAHHDAFDHCVQLGALSQSDVYRRIGQLWQLMVRRYEAVDPAILIDAVNRRLEDFQQFRDEAQAYVHSRLDPDVEYSDEEISLL